MKRILTSILLLSCCNAIAQTITIYRSGAPLTPTYTTVASAITAAVNGDSLKLSAHTFAEHDLNADKNLIIAGTYTTTDSSTIDAKRLGRVMAVRKGKSLVLRDVRIVNGLANTGSTYFSEKNFGGGIRVDTSAVLSIRGGTVIANNEAASFGGGIGAYMSSSSLSDSILVNLSDQVVIRNNKGGGINLSGSDKVRMSLKDNVLMTYNEGTGASSTTTYVGKGGSAGGLRTTNNHAVNGGGFSTGNLYLYGDLMVSDNTADSIGGGAIIFAPLYGNGNLTITRNKAKYGGGGMISMQGTDSAKVLITNNHAVYGGGIAYVPSYVVNSFSKMEVSYNIADSLGGGLYYSIDASFGGYTNIKNIDFHHNTAKKCNGSYFDNKIASLDYAKLVSCRLFNPPASGARTAEVMSPSTSTKLTLDSCWLGQSDTSRLISTGNPIYLTVSRYVQCDWVVNGGSPISWPPFPVTAKFRLSSGAPLKSGTFSMLQGRYSGSLGTFTPAIANMKTTNEIESIFKATSAGSASLLAIVDADTFKTSLAVTSITEKGFEQVSVYPNPAAEQIFIRGMTGSFSVSVCDLQGRVMLQAEDAQQLSLGHLAAGTYVLQLRNAQGQTGTVKILKR